MRFRINKKIGAAAAVNLLALAGFLTLALIGFREGQRRNTTMPLNAGRGRIRGNMRR